MQVIEQKTKFHVLTLALLEKYVSSSYLAYYIQRLFFLLCFKYSLGHKRSFFQIFISVYLKIVCQTSLFMYDSQHFTAAKYLKSLIYILSILGRCACIRSLVLSSSALVGLTLVSWLSPIVPSIKISDASFQSFALSTVHIV